MPSLSLSRGTTPDKAEQLLSFIKDEGAERYACEVRGLKKSRLRADRYSGGAIYDTPDFSQLARYQHLAELVDP